MGNADTELLSDPKYVVFIVTTLAIFLNILMVDRITEDRVVTANNVRPLVMWVACCFRSYFFLVTVLSTIGAFLVALSAALSQMPLFVALFWVVTLLVISFGNLFVHRHTVQEGVDWGILKSK